MGAADDWIKGFFYVGAVLELIGLILNLIGFAALVSGMPLRDWVRSPAPKRYPVSKSLRVAWGVKRERAALEPLPPAVDGTLFLDELNRRLAELHAQVNYLEDTVTALTGRVEGVAWSAENRYDELRRDSANQIQIAADQAQAKNVEAFKMALKGWGFISLGFVCQAVSQWWQLWP